MISPRHCSFLPPTAMPTPQPHYLKKAAALHRPRAVVPSGTFANGVDGSLPVKVTYDIAVMGGEETAYEFSESIAPAAFATKEGEGQVINALIMKYERGVFESKAWICAGKDCEKQATTFASYHMSARTSQRPFPPLKPSLCLCNLTWIGSQ